MRHLLVFLLVMFSFEAMSQTQKPRIFLNCTNDCNEDFLRTELSWFNFVRDRLLSDIEIQIIEQDHSGGGKKFSLYFTGRENLSGLQDTLMFFSLPSETTEMIRKKMLLSIKLGLVTFLKARPSLCDISINFSESEHSELEQDTMTDKWDYWVFAASAGAYGYGGSNNTYIELNGEFPVRRITDHSKLIITPYYKQAYSFYHLDGQEISGSWENYGSSILYAKSLSQHWSLGGLGQWTHNSYENIASGYKGAAVAEYNLFPFRFNTVKQLRIALQAGGFYNQYIDTTVFDKIEEWRTYGKLSLILEVNKSWGSVSAAASGQIYPDRIPLYRVGFKTNFSLRLYKGLSFFGEGNIFYIQDQISLLKNELDSDSYLLGLQQLPTDFSYEFDIGFTYTFGSIFNNVVNPRFGSIE